MNNLYNLARNGLSVAQAALRVTGDNLTNGMSHGYSRRNMIIGELGGMSTQTGFYGFGAQVNGIERAYDGFANNQLRGAISQYSFLNGRMEQLADIDNMLADESDNVSVSLGNLFKAMSTLSTGPEDAASRSAVFNSLGSLASRYNASGKRLSGLEKSTNTQIEQSVKDLNSYIKQLAEINKQLERAQGAGKPPADLLDRRDLLLEEISNQIGIEVSENVQSGRVDVTLSDGRPLVSGDKAYELKTSPSANDPNKTIVSYVDANGKETPLDEDRITKGRLAGLFKFRNEDLTLARQELDKMAFIMASRMNAQNRDGYLPDGTQGGDLFSLPPIAARANSGNMGTGKLGPIEVTDYKLVNAEEYTISYDATGWKVRGADGRLVKEGRPDDTEIEFDGLKIELPDPGDMADGDSFTFNPMSGAAEGLSRKITDAQGFAASDSEDPADKGNNKNLQKMLEIQNEPLIGGSTLAEAYASLVGTIGDNARNVKSNLTSAEIDMQTKFETKQALSGVSMDEEKINLDMFMQYYRANAQLLQTANNMFDSLLAIR
ncbi:flagellar hook-associated protein FlgK [Enterobacter ludwigii]|uniref:Flagellar hook-associated protein 1 n=1 Tax=Enterobacter ludwigii TaxID=299767 RepID=A0AAX3L5P7_9ENTR|nr:flagellar hook-associated protein FlgK [Enterobacter ludwigii]ELN9420556.1 flagellar hook-associated protein FlgK [Enterobacter ludwigii]KUQ40514.1 flagellar hook protein [Enterobacter ludwigii]MBX8912872.1 flagellar hook-associated protein FlgK [Enterobacter ludwigii]MCM7780687.1 flagellar hook-associated protein FlgK [Enterobacter ludwigii]MDH1543883.1 flagellar hook-associated protein FlgK [Enterobacter ludwigii]